jgi:hypothetical protein
VISDENQLLNRRRKGGQNVSLQDLPRLFNKNNVGLGRADQTRVLCRSCSCATNDLLLLHCIGIGLAELGIDVFLDVVKSADMLLESLESLSNQTSCPALEVSLSFVKVLQTDLPVPVVLGNAERGSFPGGILGVCTQGGSGCKAVRRRVVDSDDGNEGCVRSR